MKIQDTRAAITGGVSGLGLAVAEHLVAGGAKVALLDINDDKGAAAVAALGADKARYFRTDVTDEANVEANLAAAREFMGGLNVAVNCAGILGAGRVLGKDAPMPLKNFATTVMVNLVGSFNVAKAAADLMQHNAADEGERGHTLGAGQGQRFVRAAGERHMAAPALQQGAGGHAGGAVVFNHPGASAQQRGFVGWLQRSVVPRLRCFVLISNEKKGE